MPEKMAHFQHILEKIRHVLHRYGVREMATPMFEFTDVFFHVGDTSDIVTKETYTFQDRGGDSLTLRPEGTAPVVRSVISNGLTQNLPLKWAYAGPMFRYDRPQKGRYRQFHQVGVELIGQDAKSAPIADAEVILCAHDILKTLGLDDKCTLRINTLGDLESRSTHREKLVAYFSKFKDQLSEASQVRLEKNPLRILDSKDKKDQQFFADAPKLHECLTEDAKAHFDEVCQLLEKAGVHFELDPLIVRGLDYYAHTTFEFVMNEESAQGTVLGGGRYDGLFKQMGGPDISAVGWAAGLERLALLCDFEPQFPRPAVLIGLGDEVRAEVFTLAQNLRSEGHYVEVILGHNPGKLFKKADKLNAAYAIVMGTNELEEGIVNVKSLDSGEQKSIELKGVSDFLKQEKG